MQTAQGSNDRLLATEMELIKCIEAIQNGKINEEKFKGSGDFEASSHSELRGLTQSSSHYQICEQVPNLVRISDKVFATEKTEIINVIMTTASYTDSDALASAAGNQTQTKQRRRK